jgi:murein L,D-transpeptidase YafK
MWTGLWKIVDFCIWILFVIAIGLFYINPPSYTQLAMIIDKKVMKIKESLEEALPIYEPKQRVKFIMEIHDKPYDFVAVSLEKRLEELSLKVGNALFIRIFKKEGILETWIEDNGIYVHLKDYNICAYSGHLGPKLKEGDRQAPEGFYSVSKHHLNPNSKFHLSFNLGYPNVYDKAYERTGSFLMVHGNCVSIGCYAMTDEKIEEIYALVEGALEKGQKSVQVHAFPFRMNKENMLWQQRNKWYDFWVNLKEGYDYFETQKIPPTIIVENKRYEIYE